MVLPRARTEGVRVARDRDGDLLVYDTDRDIGHVLNQSASLVYELADGSRSVDDLAAQLHDQTGKPGDRAIVEMALQMLGEAGLLESGSEGPGSATVSRRRLMSGLALTAGIAAFLPVIDSIRGLSRAAAQRSTTRGVGTSSSRRLGDGYGYGYGYGYPGNLAF